MTSIMELFNSLFGTPHFMMVALCASITVKIGILAFLAKKGIQAPKISKPLVLLSLALTGALVCNFAWLFKLIHTLYFPTADYTLIRFIIRMAWSFHLVQFNAYSLFIETLLEKQHQLKARQKILLLISTFFFIYFFVMAIIQFGSSPADDSYEAILQTVERSYTLFIMLPFSVLFALYKLRTLEVPLILKRQLSIFIKAFIVPMLTFDIIGSYPFNLAASSALDTAVYHSLSTLLTAYMFYYCAQKIVGLRFLNLSSHVQSPQISNVNFIDKFKDVLEQLGHVTSHRELSHITQTFFKDTFNISLSRTKLYIRKFNVKYHDDSLEVSDAESIIEHFLSANTESSKSFELIKKSKVLIYDEIAFTNFYESTESNSTILKFLENINADIFLPIFDKQTLIACIVVERFARVNEFYSDVERDEMIVLASYLGNIINLLNHRNLKSLLYQEKEIKDELGGKHLEITHYKESLQSFLKNIKKNELGLLVYKNRRFSFINQTAKELIDLDINTQEGHPLTRTLKQVAKYVEEYKIAHTVFGNEAGGQRLVITGIPTLEKNSVILTVSHPEISDIIRRNLDTLKDPTKWDYLLYLETTKSGQTINHLVPGTSEIPLNFKIEFLKAALRKKAILLEMADDDLLATAKVLHQISEKDAFQIVDIAQYEDTMSLAIALFGASSLYATDQEPPLLARLDQTGTLFIKNIHLMPLELQRYLTEFIKYGYYHNYGSDQKITSSVNIICSSSENLTNLAHEDKFSRSLLAELKNNALTMPALSSFSEQELFDLANDFVEEALSTETFKNLLEFTEKETYKLIQPAPASLAELNERVEQFLAHKSKRNQITSEQTLIPAHTITDPELIEAAQLGKQALKDPKIMALLWDRFKNQNKIATFLGVNRSSINRRLKDFKLN